MRIFVLFILMVLWCGCVSTEYGVGTHRQDIYLYSTEKEVTMGKNINKQIQAVAKISQDPRSIERLHAIGDEIAKVCDRQEINYYFYVIDEEEKNAFSIPGGYVYIYQGLMDILTDDELAFVVAHEIGHIVSRHAIKRLQAALGMNLVALASTQAESSDDFSGGVMFALSQLMVAYSREDEFNADELAAKYLSLLNRDPTAGIKVMNKLFEERKKEALKDFPYFRTHPYTAQRIRHIKEVLGLPLDISDYIN